MFSRLFCRTVSQVNPEPLLPVVNQESSQSTPREETPTRIPSNSGRRIFNRAVRQAQAEAEQKRAHKASMKLAQRGITLAQERLATAMAGADEALAKQGGGD